jgi:hypothetical protein
MKYQSIIVLLSVLMPAAIAGPYGYAPAEGFAPLARRYAEPDPAYGGGGGGSSKKTDPLPPPPIKGRHSAKPEPGAGCSKGHKSPCPEQAHPKKHS